MNDISTTTGDGFDLVGTPSETDFRAAYLRFVKGKYLLGPEREPIAVGTQFRVLGAREGWLRLAKGEPARRIPREPGKPFPSRSELGDNDPAAWPKFDGQPSDPWTLNDELLLVEQETGRPVILSTTSWSGREAVAALCRLITYQRRVRGPRARPVISLDVGNYFTPRGGMDVPRFTITAWEESAQEPAPSELAKDMTEVLEKRAVVTSTAKSTAEPTRPKRQTGRAMRRRGPASDDSDIDDGIPF